MTTQLITASYSDAITISFTESAWFNATNVAKSFGKQAKEWSRLDSTSEYIDKLIEVQKRENPAFDKNQLISIKKGAPENGGGTWLHPKLAVPFARWLDVGFSIWCDMQIEKILHPQPFGNSEQLESPTITKAQQGELFTRAKHIAGESGKIRAAIWSRFQNHFHLSSYKDLPYAQYDEAIAYLDRLQHEYNNGVEMLYISNLELEALIQDRVKALPAPEPSQAKEGELLARLETLLESAPTEEAVIKKLMERGFFIAPKDLMQMHFKRWVDTNKFCDGWKLM